MPQSISPNSELYGYTPPFVATIFAFVLLFGVNDRHGCCMGNLGIMITGAAGILTAAAMNICFIAYIKKNYHEYIKLGSFAIFGLIINILLLPFSILAWLYLLACIIN